ncbi:MAG: helix-turn-helix transcriptional regulator [Blautia sp.]|nr:helix-turn-helix transcriptional regulator [Blautia sp.]MDY5112698.1 helix-turn-helix transcriptional regulator [Bilifractor sp.]
MATAAFFKGTGGRLFSMIDARNREGLTQKELSDRTGITQADISRIENGTRNPSLGMVKRLANGLGMRLKIEFIPGGTVKPAE